MLHALGAASSALDILKSLAAPKSQSTGNKQDSKSLFDVAGSTGPEASPSKSGAGGGSLISPATMSALLAALGHSTTEPKTLGSASRSDPLKDLFVQIDADSDGKLSKSEFADALGAGGTNLAQAESVFGKLDRNGDGSVSLGEMASALRSKGHRQQHDVVVADGTAGSGAPDAAGTDPLTSAAASSAATSSYNFTEQMIQHQAKATSSAGSLSLSA